MPLAACQSAPGAGVACRGGDVSLSSPRTPSPITSGALNSCRSPGCLSQGPPGCRVTAPGATVRNPQHPEHGSCCAHPAPAPALHPRTPGLGVLCIHSTGYQSIPPAMPIAHPGLIQGAQSPPSPMGMLVLGLPAKISRVDTQNVQSCASPPRPHRHMGLNNLDLFPRGRGLQQGLIH